MSIIGGIIYKLYYRPKGKRAIIKKFGGKQSYRAMLDAEGEMKLYALNNLTINDGFGSNGKYKINFLTGEKYIHQTLFCTYSFFKFLSPVESRDFSVNFYSDGTLHPGTLDILKSRFPQITIIGIDETRAAVQQHLPLTYYPYLNKRLGTQPLFKKLIYPHLNKRGLSIFFDSDMLFLKRPDMFLNWLKQESDKINHAFGIRDIQRSYGYNDSEILDIWPVPLKNNINSGMYAIHSEHIDFQFIENMGTAFEKKYGTQYYIEQLMTAIILEKTGALFMAPQSEYIVLPSREQIRNQEGTLHHYVNESKELYFKEGWIKQLIL